MPTCHEWRRPRIGVRTAPISTLLDLPTIDEGGVKRYDNSSWMTMAVPAATRRKEIVTRLNSELSAILKMPDVQEKSAAVGAIIVGGTPE